MHYYSEALLDTVSEFHAEAPQAIAIEGLAQGPYVAARAGFEPTTLLAKGDESTNEPPCPTIVYSEAVVCRNRQRFCAVGLYTINAQYPVSTCMHTNTHTYTHAYICAHIHTCTRTYINIYIHS